MKFRYSVSSCAMLGARTFSATSSPGCAPSRRAANTVAIPPAPSFRPTTKGPSLRGTGASPKAATFAGYRSLEPRARGSVAIHGREDQFLGRSGRQEHSVGDEALPELARGEVRDDHHLAADELLGRERQRQS